MPVEGGQRQLVQQLVHQRGWRGQRLRERVEAGLAAGERLGVAHELEARVHRVAQHVGQVVQVQRAQMPCLVLHAQRAKGPGQRVAAAVAHVHVVVGVQRRKARAFRQQAARGHAVRQRGVAPLQVGDGRADAAAVGAKLVQKGVHAARAPCFGLGQRTAAHGRQPGGREDFQDQRQRQVFLHGADTARAQEAGEVGGGRVGRVELRHRRDEAQDAQAGLGHAGIGGGPVPGLAVE